jgi:hypothetical protein
MNDLSVFISVNLWLTQFFKINSNFSNLSDSTGGLVILHIVDKAFVDFSASSLNQTREESPPKLSNVRHTSNVGMQALIIRMT